MRKIFISFSRTTLFGILLLSLMSTKNIFAQCPNDQISGKVFLDTNLDGNQLTGEPGIGNIRVEAFGIDGLVYGEDITKSDGSYSITDLIEGEDYRIIFSYPENYSVSYSGLQNGTGVQFANSSTCDVSLALVTSMLDCGPDPDIFVTCFVRGDASTFVNEPTIVGLNYKFSPSSTPFKVASKQTTGSIWGLAYSLKQNALYSSAFVKQYASLTSSGHDAIFRTDLETQNTSLFVKLSDLGVNVGTLSITDAQDCDYGSQVGKLGIGSIEISSDNTVLYVSNLFDNTIVKINLLNPNAETTEVIQVPDPGCNNRDFRIFALKEYQGKLFVGGTCTEESADIPNPANTTANVYELDLSDNSFELIFSTPQIKGNWAEEESSSLATSHWLTDLEFTQEGNMILGLTDRVGHRYCHPTTDRLDAQNGDILMVYNDKGVYKLENNGQLGSGGTAIYGSGIDNGQGPGGGEFFGQDEFPEKPTLHPDVAIGALFLAPGKNEVIATVYDPLYNTYSGGLHRYDVRNGVRVNGIELYSHEVEVNFGKAVGFGNVVAKCGLMPPEVGNYIWCDENANGLQDVGEGAVANLKINAYDSQCRLVGTTTSSTQGIFNFNPDNIDIDFDGKPEGFNTTETYYAMIDPSQYNKEHLFYESMGTRMFPTLIVNGDEINSDLKKTDNVCPDLDRLGMITIKEDFNNHNLDIGLAKVGDYDLALIKELVSDDIIRIGDTVTFRIQIENQGAMIAKEVVIIDYLADNYGFINDPEVNPGWKYDGKNAKIKVKQTFCPGQKEEVEIKLKMIGGDPTQFTNIAEISGSIDQFGDPGNDIDSQADEDPFNDNVGTPGLPPGPDAEETYEDEDDHDVEPVRTFDLALIKKIRDPKAYSAEELVTFDIQVCNQGAITSNSVQVSEDLDNALIYVPAANTGWDYNPGVSLSYDYNDQILPNECIYIPITYRIPENALSECIVTYSEISAFTTDMPGVNKDYDSVADSDFTNDIGGKIDDITDDLNTDVGIIDEDDHDPAVVKTRYFDLALQKISMREKAEIGDLVEFEISIHNQGQIPAYSVIIVDYVPEGTSVVDPTWTQDVNDPLKYMKTMPFLNGFWPGDIYTTSITLKVDHADKSKFVVNYAEIVSSTDDSGNELSHIDIDSEGDNIRDNDNGGEVNSSNDNNISDDGQIDEDDHDPARVFVDIPSTSIGCECLNNATNELNGQFADTIRFSKPEGEKWYIDFVDNIYDPTSPAEVPTPFITGPLGYTLTPIKTVDEVSEYEFIGIFETGTTWSVRLTNGEGDFVQNQGGHGCDYNTPNGGITGVLAVCGQGIESYSVDAQAGCTYEWSLDGGGVFVDGVMNGAEVEVNWTGIGGPYTLTVKQTCTEECDAPISVQVNVGETNGAISCIHDINISLDSDCSVRVTPSLLLTSSPDPSAAYEVVLMDPHGDPILNNTVTDAHIGVVLTAKLMDACSGNSCWANVIVEDKLAPVLDCGPIVLDCHEMESYQPIAIDNCSYHVDIKLIDETITPMDCHKDYIKEVERTYIAEDENGNVSEECVQTIRLRRLNMDLIDYPDSFEDEDALSCDKLILNDEGTPDVSVTGVPKIRGKSIYPDFDYYCNIAVTHTDRIINDDGCNKKYMRTWLVYEAWCSVGRIDTVTQIIEVRDKEDPVITCPDDITMSSANIGCKVDVNLPFPTIVDDCTKKVEDFKVDVQYGLVFIEDLKPGQSIEVDAGINMITYRAYDQCGNYDECVVTVYVDDQNPPVAVCDEFTAIALRADGSAEVHAEVFDDGSTDDCSLKKFLVRKMESDCPCDIPTFNDHDYLGTYGGHYYYLSHILVPGQKAHKLSAAHGGYVANIETEAEHDFIYNAVSAIHEDEYYIGLNDIQTEGKFVWTNGTSPTYSPKWTGNLPTGDGDYVIIEKEGTWTDVVGTSRLERYVMEVSDPCGFSDYVSFCCDDVKIDPEDNPMVVFRAIDYFGNYNQCMVTTEIQDKTAPDLKAPADEVVECGTNIDMNNLSAMFGTYTATDACVVRIDSTTLDSINTCGVGKIIRAFVASDNNGSSRDTQTITVVNSFPFDPGTIVFPADTTISDGCSDGEIAPENLNGFPTWSEDACDMVAATYSDEVYLFAGNSTACFKVLRTWAVIDWCRMNVDPSYEPEYREQTIKINNTTQPTFLTGCTADTLYTLNCDADVFNFTASAEDDCTPDEFLANNYTVDLFTDGVLDSIFDSTGNEIDVDLELPLGCHVIFYTFEDKCGNKATCAKEVCIVNDKAPTATCVYGLGIALEPMDTDSIDGPDNEMACLFAEMLNASSTPACPGDTLYYSFSADTSDTKITYDCFDIGIDTVELWVTDQDGNTDFCVTTVEVQDNNLFDFCPSFDLALKKTLNSSTSGPFQENDLVSYDITVYNQGDYNAFNIGIVDYIPEGLTLIDGSWSTVGDSAYYSLPIDLVSGDSTLISIAFRIDVGFTGRIINVAEIFTGDNDTDPDNDLPFDEDSNPDQNPDNDGIPIDDEVNDPINDEDDHDIEIIEVHSFDLAMDKRAIGAGPFSNNDPVDFTIRVFNQGSLIATDVVVTDYVPAGFDFVQSENLSFTETNGVVSATIASIPPLSSSTLDIRLRVADDFIGSQLINNAEITAASNALGFEDEDDPLSNVNDGTNPELGTDNDIQDNPDNPADEDDYDPAAVDITCSVPPICNVRDNVTLQLDANGMASLNSSTIDLGSAAVCNSNPVTFNISQTDFDCDDIGNPTTISVTVTDDIGNVSTNDCEVIVTIIDEVPPTVTCQDINTGFDMNGDLILNINEVVTSTSDNCVTVTSEFDLSTVNEGELMDCIPQTALVVTTDLSGNSSTCSFTITIEDEDDPICVPNDTTIVVGSPGQIVTIDSSFVASGSFDQCSGISTISVTPNEFDCDDAGNTIEVTIVVTDNSGNSSTCTADVTIEDATTPMCEVKDITVGLNSNGSVVVNANLIDDGSMGGCNGNFGISISPNTFFCNDLGDNPVVFTLTTTGGARCTANAVVTVHDSIPPTITCPDDMLLPCGTDISDLSVFGTPVVNDNCLTSVNVTSTVVSNLNVCNVGVITRRFTVTDGMGNFDVCEQIITIEAGMDALMANDITWPDSPFTLGDCIDNPNIGDIDSGFPLLTGDFDCVVDSIGFVDVDPDPSNTNLCNKDYERVWTVIDSCQLNGQGAGIFTFTQIIRLRDTIAPFFNFVPDNVLIELPAPACDAVVNLSAATATDTCSNMTPIIVTNDSPYANNNNSGDASGTYPAGLTLVNFFAEDICGNISSEQIQVSIVDTVVNGFDCNKQILQLPDSLTLPISAYDFQVEIDTSSNCGGLSWTVSFSDTDPFDSIKVLGCQDLGITNPIIYLFAASELIDDCVAEIMLTNPSGGCPEPPSSTNGNITGQVSTEEAKPIAAVEVELFGSDMPEEMTTNQGGYAFPIMPLGGDYAVVPYKNTEPLNGVTTLDLIGIQQHLLGLRQLDSPYKMVAADVDKSGNISTIDVLELRKLILGIYQELPDNTSWRMIDALYEFPDPSNPFLTPISEQYDIYDMDSDMAVDFIGVKIGDVNNSAIPNLNEPKVIDRSSETIELLTEEKYLEPGVFEVSITSEQIELIQGFQFTFEVNNIKADLLDVVPNNGVMEELNFATHLKENGLFTCSWETQKELPEGTELFKIILNMNSSGWLSEILSINSKITTKEAYTENDIHDLEISFTRDNISDQIVLYQNQPNPWLDYTEVSFYSNAQRSVSFKVFDVNGRLLHEREIDAHPGYNTVQLQNEDVSGSGVMYYEVISDQQRYIKKMISIK